MKVKALSVIIAVLLILSMVAACGQTADRPEESVQPANEEKADDSVQPAPSDPSSDAGDKKDEEMNDDTDSQIADSSEMIAHEDVVEDGMVPIYGESIRDGEYPITVESSSSMFNIVSAVLKVKDGVMTADMTMSGKGYTYVFMGTPKEAVAADETQYIGHTEDSDGAHVFTVPVEALDAGQDCAAFSTKKEKWYERTLVFRADSLPLDAFAEGYITTAESLGLKDGEYTVEVTLSGGSGRASVASPANFKVSDGTAFAEIIWSSSNYDYMVVDGEKYLPVNTDSNSVFEIPVSGFDINMPVSADTTAMSTPHEIEYTLNFDSSTITVKP